MTLIFQYRGLVRSIVTRELAGRYQGTLLGPLWLLIPPVFLIFIYSVVFSQFMRARLPGSTEAFSYSIHLCAGMLVWGPFLEAMQRARGVFIEHANLIKKSAFPRPVLFVPVVLLALVNFLLLAAAFVVFLTLVGAMRWEGLSVLAWIPFAALLSTLLGLAIGALLSVLNVFFRDVGQFTDLAAQLLFWATPIVYPVAILPVGVAKWLTWNPLLPLVSVSQQAALGLPVTPSLWLWWPVALSGLLLFLATGLYARARVDLLDRL